MNKTHGKSKTAIYSVHNAMMNRCYNPKNPAYKNYGGRGIKVCDRWHDVQNYIQDIGARPSPEYSIDRIDNDGNYEPDNIRWATNAEQNQNRRQFRTVNGHKKPKTTTYFGVAYLESRSKFRADITYNKQSYFLGHYDDVEQAALAYDCAAIQLCGDMAYSNILQSA